MVPPLHQRLATFCYHAEFEGYSISNRHVIAEGVHSSYVLCVGVLMSLSARNLVNGKAAGDGRQQPGSARDSISSDGDDQVTE